jgi:hypothetical protein
MSTDRRCGRPKADGEPCRNVLLHPALISCRVHRAEGDDAIEAGRQELWKDTWDKAYELGKQSARRDMELVEMVQRLEAERAACFRLHEDGAQVVQVGRYAYKWRGEPLSVGDEVLVPGNWLVREPQWLTVTGFGSDYDGALSFILNMRKVEDGDRLRQGQG